MDQICVQGEIIQENTRIEWEIVEFYQSLHTKTVHWRPAYHFPNCPILSMEENESMQGSFEEEEVLRCLKLEPDDVEMSYHGIFIKCWEVYAYDTLIFGDADDEQIKILRVILVLFEGMSGLHINRRKSFLYPINEVITMKSLNAIRGREIGSLPTVYLGMPLGAKSKSKENWNTIGDLKFETPC
ncbi:hypothetical protein H5410_045178 [Solanum commersonii]|uniref:Uncharacterized protein n=1 Tax=Solanum commersonii TaxID=4109 RepID=A0A9J5XCY2_SOLCO|nr:hypothetical protein H5410_045178 [Solanum commersonii]